jgi:hypothetical protein
MTADQTLDAISLATTELVTNAVRHGSVSQDDRIVLVVDLDNDIARIDVEQPTSASGARVVESPGVNGGFGLAIVDAVSERWGVMDGQPGHVVRDLARPLDHPSSCAERQDPWRNHASFLSALTVLVNELVRMAALGYGTSHGPALRGSPQNPDPP